jgi:phosphoribosylformylglycinamidine (FGAM) synthase PurS component
MKLEAWVPRKTRDLVLDSAEELLRDKAPEVTAVGRAEVWSFDVEGRAAETDVRRVLDETTLVVNPNVHRYSLAGGDEPPPAGSRLTVRVMERFDPKEAAVLRGIRERCGVRAVHGVSRSVVWTLDLKEGDAQDAERVGRVVASILANPHAQDLETDVAVVS